MNSSVASLGLRPGRLLPQGKYLKESNEGLLRRCFDIDWEYMKDVAKKYKKSEEGAIKEEMFKVWK